MMRHRRAPGVQNRRDADARAQPPDNIEELAKRFEDQY
jgi:hypothetical protein